MRNINKRFPLSVPQRQLLKDMRKAIVWEDKSTKTKRRLPSIRIGPKDNQEFVPRKTINILLEKKLIKEVVNDGITEYELI